VKVAIRMRNLVYVKMLVERAEIDVLDTDDGNSSSTVAGDPVPHPRPSKPLRQKRRKLEDRVVITSELVREAVKADARDIVEYFVHVKGCSPNLKTLEQLVRNSIRTG